MQKQNIPDFPIVIYCEGKHQWLHLKNILDECIRKTNVKILFLSSDQFFPYKQNELQAVHTIFSSSIQYKQLETKNFM